MNSEDITFYLLRYGERPNYKDLEFLLDKAASLKIVRAWLLKNEMEGPAGSDSLKRKFIATRKTIDQGRVVFENQHSPFRFSYLKEETRMELEYQLRYQNYNIRTLYKELSKLNE